MGHLLGLGDVWASAIGFTGYVFPGYAVNFGQRLEADVLQYHPDTVIVAGGLNDLERTTPQALSEAAVTLFRRIRQALPNARLFALGPWFPNGLVSPQLAQEREAIHAAVVSAGGWFIDNTRWITGTGSTVTPKGDGNADTFIGPIEHHPTAAGYAYIGARLAAALQALPPNAGR